jgi:hypothetical protein
VDTVEKMPKAQPRRRSLLAFVVSGLVLVILASLTYLAVFEYQLHHEAPGTAPIITATPSTAPMTTPPATTQAPAPSTTTAPATQPKPAPSASCSTSAIPRTNPAPTPAPGAPTAPLAGLKWFQACPSGQRFRVRFPHSAPSAPSSYRQLTKSSATSRTGHRAYFSSTVYRAPNGQFCATAADHRCHGPHAGPETYFVSVIPSKYTDPCQALTAINGGIGRQAACKTDARTGFLTANFHDIYGGPGRTIWVPDKSGPHGSVYYLGSFNHPATPTSHFTEFADSITFH